MNAKQFRILRSRLIQAELILSQDIDDIEHPPETQPDAGTRAIYRKSLAKDLRTTKKTIHAATDALEELYTTSPTPDEQPEHHDKVARLEGDG